MVKGKKTKKLEEKKVINGRLPEESIIEQHKKVQQAYGETKRNPFGTENEEEFLKKLGQMSTAELQELSIKLGQLPSYRLDIMRKRIEKSFKDFISRQNGSYKLAKTQTGNELLDNLSNDKKSGLLKILAQGK